MMRSTIYADLIVLREFAELIERLRFESPEIIDLKQYSTVRVLRSLIETRKSLLVTDGVRVVKKWRCGLSKVEEYLKDGEYFFINHLDNKDKEQDEDITSFFVRKFIYSTFFEKLLPLSLKEVYSREEAIQLAQEWERKEREREKRER